MSSGLVQAGLKYAPKRCLTHASNGQWLPPYAYSLWQSMPKLANLKNDAPRYKYHANTVFYWDWELYIVYFFDFTLARIRSLQQSVARMSPSFLVGFNKNCVWLLVSAYNHPCIEKVATR